MRTILKIALLFSISGCSLLQKTTPQYVLDDAKAAKAIEALGKDNVFFLTNDKLLAKGFIELETRIREIEKRLKIPSPPLPTPTPEVETQ